MQNPYLSPPWVEGPESRSWGMGFAFGFQGPKYSVWTPMDVAPEDATTFDEGVLAGQESAINGLPLSQACMDLYVERPHILEILKGSIEAPVVIHELLKKAFAGAIASGVLLVVELSLALETFSEDPGKALQSAALQLQKQLAGMGFDSGMELFVGGGIDLSQKGCELLLSPIFRDQTSAANAALSLGRQQSLVVGWRTDQSGGMKIYPTR